MNVTIQSPLGRIVGVLVAAGMLVTACSGGSATPAPSRAPSAATTVAPSVALTSAPSASATSATTQAATASPTEASASPTEVASASPSESPSASASTSPSASASSSASPSGSGSASASPSGSAGSPTYEACATAATTPITLADWDQEVREGIGPSIDQLETEFMAANPGVKIERTSKSFEDLKATLLQALQDPSGPDIAQVNQGRPDMGKAVQGGLLLPLTPYLTKYGWDTRWGQGVHARNSFTEDGKTFGQGNVYGVSVTGEIVGIYYNKEKFSKLALSEPKSWDEFMTQLQTIKDAGETPIAFGDQGGGGSIQVYGSILETMLDRKSLDDFIFGNPGAKFDTPEAMKAAETLLSLADKGYFTDGYAGIKIDDAAVAFGGGDGVYFWGGSWYGAGLTEKGGENFGFMRTPPQTAGGSALSIGGVGLPWAISKNSKNPECAAALLDYLTGDHAMELVAAKGVLPSHAAPNAAGPGDLFNSLAAAFADANGKDEVGHYLDWAFAGGYDTINAELAKLLAKQSEPSAFVKAVEKEYQDFLSSLK